MMRNALVVIPLVFSLGCVALGQLFKKPEDTVAVMVRPDPLYEMILDRYIELCAVSQYRPLNKPPGGSPGHAVMYLKGACFDEAAGYPRLRKCKGREWDSSHPEHGAGVSVNRWFKNVNWVATPGKKLFFDGNLGTYQTLDQAHFDATVQDALDRGMYRGLETHAESDDVPVRSIPDFVAQSAIGTDFALRFGRSVFCARLPMSEDMLTEAMDYLNDLNDEYYHGEADYHWSGFADNCVHTLHNALAAAGVWKPKSTRAVKIRQFFHMAVPANTFVELAFLSNGYPIENYDKIRRDELYWNNLKERGWLPATPGALVKTLAVHQDNELYDSKFRMFSLEGWFSTKTLNKAHQLLTDGRFTSIDANLRFFDDRYGRILAEQTDPNLLEKVRGTEYLSDRDLYYVRVAQWKKAVEEALDELAELDQLREKLLEPARALWDIHTRDRR